jgi:hypothetical protein
MNTYTENPMSDDLAPYTARVSAIDASTPFPDVANVLGLIDEGMRRLRELKAEAEAVAVEQLRRDGPQVVGTVRYYAGPTKDHKCRDVRATVDLLMGLDLAVLGECLSTSAVKAGAFRKAVADVGKPELFGEHFETVERWDVKEGKPTARLQKVDTAFLKGGA